MTGGGALIDEHVDEPRTARLRPPDDAPPAPTTGPTRPDTAPPTAAIGGPDDHTRVIAPVPPTATVPPPTPTSTPRPRTVVTPASARVVAPVARTLTVLSVLAVVAGLVWSALLTGPSELLWLEWLLVPLAALAVATTAAGRGGFAITTGVVAVATHGEAWIESLRDPLAAAVQDRDVGPVLALLTTAQGGAWSLLVTGGLVAVAAGVAVATARARNQGRRSPVA